MDLEKLYQAKIEFDNALKEVKAEQSKVKDEIKKKRNFGWDRMFDDLYSFRKYSNFIDTGINLYNSGKETLGFEIRDEYICVISWEHLNGDGRRIEPRTETYFFSITRDKPFETDSHYSAWMKHVIKAVENWEQVLPEIEKRIATKMELDMAKKLLESKRTQVELEEQLKAISR